MKQDQEYPSVRKALFGQDTVANLYCACKWLLWHLFYILFVVLGVIVVTVLTFGFLLLRVGLFIGKLIKPFLPSLPSPNPEKRKITINTPSTPNVKETVKNTPGARRIYNECPVDLKINPKWVEALSDIGEKIAEWAKPPGKSYVCDECGKIYEDRHSKPIGCYGCLGEDISTVKASKAEQYSESVKSE